MNENTQAGNLRQSSRIAAREVQELEFHAQEDVSGLNVEVHHSQIGHIERLQSEANQARRILDQLRSIRGRRT